MDRNSKYFYNVLKGKRMKPQILSLEIQLGIRLTEEKDIQKEAIRFMKNMLAVSSRYQLPDPEIIYGPY